MKKILLMLCVGVMFTACSTTEQTVDKQTDDTQQENKFEELTKDAEKHEGYFDLYQKDGSLYLSVSEDQLNEQFLMNFELARGIGAAGLYGGSMLSIFEGLVVSMEKNEGKVMLVQHPHRYNAGGNESLENALNLAYGTSVLETAEVEAFNADSSQMLINVHDWFVGELSNISQRLSYAVGSNGQPGRVTFDKSRSHLEKVQAFPENVNIQAKLTFNNASGDAPRTVADGRYIPLSLFYTMVKLPEEPMKPRMADDRTGYFMTVHKDFSKESDNFYKRYVNRWRLECEDEVADGELCTPKKPITYYIDHTVPEKYRGAMMDGVEAWSKAFEAAGFKDAVQAEMLPEDAMAEDIRYPTLRWSTSDQPGYGAIGPSVVDPRTGEIMDADILFEASMLLGDKQTYRNLVEPRTAIDEIFNVSDKELALMSKGVKTESFYNEMNAQFDLAQSVLMANGQLKADDPVPEEFVNQALKWVTMHEVGHTLGLRHNFRSSIDTPLDKLYDKEWGEENGVFSSAMEYPSINLHPENKSEDAYYYNPGVGSYDRWVISYGYTTDDEKAEEIARQAAQPGHAYGTDEDARGAGAVDPHVNVYDLGSNPLAWGKERADLLSGLIPQIADIKLEDNAPYFEATDLFQSYLYQYARVLAPAIKYIGGQHQYRDHVGDPDGRMPFEPVDYKEQKEALNMIVDFAFVENAVVLPQDIFQKMGADRWSHWGNSTTYGGRVDYPLHGTMLGIQDALLEQLLDPVRLSRIRDTEVKFGADQTVTIPELMTALTESIWSEAQTSPGSNIASNRRDLQRAYLNKMEMLVTDAPDEAPADARSIARQQLKTLHSWLEARLAPPTYDFDEYTHAHLEESKARIEAALEAGLEIES
ncbi:zinc-dependent metalloprotease [Fodinibius sp. Rm-B-1B1-1]|uniref:zinc-dependent metalloprotease n=1 Tax=Fodinibius alkaliphilus TaxID=3140241 RepID=UPI00315A7613